ncbi:MAG TPA: transglutaminase-like domain-containing protein, partial [Limnochordia bacterium]|nr:transglutaminase-like domain-containing protein [Limnochordia bacterium]
MTSLPANGFAFWLVFHCRDLGHELENLYHEERQMLEDNTKGALARHPLLFDDQLWEEYHMHPFALSEAELSIIKDRLAEKKALAKNQDEALFGVFDGSLCPEEQVALEFLYAFMPLIELADYEGDLFLEHVRHSLRAIKEAPWGSKVSGELFLHYILPYRISNERIEDFRPYFWNELFDRVKGLSMADAILEVNHWCHEKATYVASDPRTLSPLSLVQSARGRCGEESALLVAALRSLGIPARQVYVPRWAHTDSNHAWVEAWADGEWFFLGACEPEPRLNMGWFDSAAKRAMFIHTRVPGTIYSGSEEIVQVRDDYTELNVLPSYAPTRKVTVQVRDLQEQAVVGADVEFQVYNYGGFSTLVSIKTDDKGSVSLTTGYGDLQIHASYEQEWGTVFLDHDHSPIVTVDLVLEAERQDFQQFTIQVPKEVPRERPEICRQEREKHDQRLQEEDQIRTAYEQTFVNQEQAVELAVDLDIDSEKVWTLLEKARGNSHEIASYLKQAVPEYGKLALDLVDVLAAKDLVDTRSAILIDHLEGAYLYEELYPPEDFIQYMLQPRAAYESLGAYREFFQGRFTLDEQEILRHNPPVLKAWIDEYIAHVDEGTIRSWPTPKGVYMLRAGDALAKKILFVAMARSFGTPARISPIDDRLQYMDEERWVGLDEGEEDEVALLRIHSPRTLTGEARYFRDFSLARLENGIFRTLRFRGLDEEAFDDEAFQAELELLPGYYRLMAGNRLAGGNVLVTLAEFELEPEEQRDIELVLPSEAQLPEARRKLPAGLAFKSYG